MKGQTQFCEIWVSRDSVAEDSSHLGQEAMPNDKQFEAFELIIASSSTESRIFFLATLTL